MVRRELKVKYRGTFLGYLWSMLNPLMFMTVIAFVFSHLVKGIPHYEVFILAGIVAWNMVAQTIEIGTSSIVANASLLKKVAVPIWIFPMVPMGSGVINMLLSLIPYTIILYLRGMHFPVEVVYLPLVVLAYAAFLSGIALALSTLNVFFRDIAHVLGPILTLVFYATPVIYDRSNPALPEYVRELLLYNPFSHYIECFRGAIYSGDAGILSRLPWLYGFAFVSLFIGFSIYRVARNRILFRL